MKKLIAILNGFMILNFASAYTYYTCDGQPIKWTAATFTMNAAANSFPAGIWADALQTAIDTLNQHPSNFWYSVAYGDTSIGFQNGQSETWWTTDDSVLSGAPARTFQYWECLSGGANHMQEADMIFDSRVAYTPYMLKSVHLNYAGTQRPFQNTALHELGHGVPLAHTNDTYNIMGDDWNHIHVNGPNTRAYLGEDAGNGANFLYGNFAYEDLSVTHWMYNGTHGEYSTHKKTQVYDSAGNVLATSVVAGETVFWAQPGQVIQAEFTYENNGLSPQTVQTGFYISTNDLITTDDRLIATATQTLARDFVLTNKYILQIPSDLVSGSDYWIGTIVDYTNAVPESVEVNNATYLPIHIY